MKNNKFRNLMSIWFGVAQNGLKKGKKRKKGGKREKRRGKKEGKWGA